MPFEISFNKDASQLWVVFSGVLTIDDIRESWSKRTENETLFKKARFIVADYSQASMELLDTTDTRMGAEWPINAAQVNPNITLISILLGDLEFGRARQWGSFVELKSKGDIPWEFIFVKSKNECEEYLRMANLRGPKNFDGDH